MRAPSAGSPSPSIPQLACNQQDTNVSLQRSAIARHECGSGPLSLPDLRFLRRLTMSNHITACLQ